MLSMWVVTQHVKKLLKKKKKKVVHLKIPLFYMVIFTNLSRFPRASDAQQCLQEKTEIHDTKWRVV